MSNVRQGDPVGTRSAKLTQRLSASRATIRVPPQPMDPALARERVDRVLTGDLAKDTRNVANLLEMIHAFDSSRDIGEYLDRVVDMVVEMTSADRGILLLAEGVEQAKVVAARDRQRQTIVRLQRFSHGLVRQAIATGTSVCVVDAEEEDGTLAEASLDGLDVKAVMCVPLNGRQGPIGAMYVDSRYRAREFTPADLRFFEAICHQAALSIEHARMTRYVVETEGLAAIGDVTAQLLDELSRGARAIKGSAAMLQTFELEPADVRRIGDEVEGFVDYIVRLLSSIQSYSVLAETFAPRAEDAASFLQAVIGRQQTRCAEQGIRVQLEAPAEITVEMDRDKLGRALEAVVANAVEAMPEGGELRVRLEVSEDTHCTVVISDTGVGIPADVLPRALLPFETCGKPNRAGLGLALAKRIVDEHGGTIQLLSVPGRGTDVSIRLPRQGLDI